jgi:hypothetical protein
VARCIDDQSARASAAAARAVASSLTNTEP